MKAVFEKKDYFNAVVKHIKKFKGFPPMFHTHCELIYVVDGEVNMVIDGVEHTLKKGEISAVFPYVVHSYENAPEAEVFILMFDPSTVAVFEGILLTKKPQYPYTEKLPQMSALFERVEELFSKNEPQSNDLLNEKTVSSYLCAIVGELLGVMPLCDVDPLSVNTTQSILSYCSEHYADDDIGIQKISDELYISTSYVSKVFSQKLKFNFREYINMLRISQAKKQLAETDMKIVDIMLETGFKNQSSFNRIFTQLCGLSPREYRQKKKKPRDK